MDQARKEQILNEAARAFARRGYKRASVDAIARAARVAKGTIYLACDSKADLYYQVLHRETRRWVGEVSRLIDPRRPADELLAVLAFAGLDLLEQSPLVRDLLHGRTRGLLPGSPGWTDQLDELRALGRQNLVEVLRLGVRQRLFRADLDLERTAALLQDLHLATEVLHRGRRSNEERLELHGAALRLALDGLRARARAADRS